MFRRKLCTGSAALTCLAAFQIANAAPAYRVLYHERLEIAPRVDHAFSDQFSDPAGEIISRMDVVDGIWSSQVGIHIALGTINVVGGTDDPFSATTVPTDLLAEVATYRGKLPANDSSGLTHLMSGRTLDGNIIGIAYVGAVCASSDSVSLSDTTVSTTMGALVAAHELGHNFNSPHDGVAGACAATPQTYLMAPQINFSNQFSSCSLTQITLRASSASCLQQAGSGSSGGSSGSGGTASSGTSSSGGTVSDPGSSGTAGSSSSGGGGGSLDLTWLVALSAGLMSRLRGPTRRRR
jgi:Metallo-peptidase family M12